MLNTNKTSSKSKAGRSQSPSKKPPLKPLGRGLESLFGNHIHHIQAQRGHPEQGHLKTKEKPHLRIWNIAIHKITPGATQPRKFFEKEKLQELADSIKQQGVLQPVIVKKITNSHTGSSDSKTPYFEILAGERRWRASQMAGLKTIPAIIKEKTINEQSKIEMALIENIQRENLNPIEEASAYYKLLSKHRMTQEQISKKVGKDRATIANTLRLLKLSPQIQKLISDGKISIGHAKVLLSVNNLRLQKKLASQVCKQELSVHKLAQIKQKLERSALKSKTSSRLSSQKANTLAEKAILKMAEDLQKSLRTKVQISSYKKGKGQITIHYYSNDQLTAISNQLKLVSQKI